MKFRFSLAILGLAAVTTSFALAQNPKETKPAPKAPAPPSAPTSKNPAPAAHDDHAMQLPPGMTEADMMACMEAATPGPQHAHLAKSVGKWNGKSVMWMTPTAEPMKSECTSTVTTMMDGRFTKCEMSGDMPGMGPFNGFGIYGFDNVGQKFQCTWIDNCGTGMMNGVGELSSDSKTMTWTFTYNCPITKKPTTMREIERWTGKDTMTMEMHGTDPKTGKEFKMMEIALTRVPGGTAAVESH